MSLTELEIRENLQQRRRDWWRRNAAVAKQLLPDLGPAASAEWPPAIAYWRAWRAEVVMTAVDKRKTKRMVALTSGHANIDLVHTPAVSDADLGDKARAIAHLGCRKPVRRFAISPELYFKVYPILHLQLRRLDRIDNQMLLDAVYSYSSLRAIDLEAPETWSDRDFAIVCFSGSAFQDSLIRDAAALQSPRRDTILF